jgi:hypothetical protein
MSMHNLFLTYNICKFNIYYKFLLYIYYNKMKYIIFTNHRKDEMFFKCQLILFIIIFMII